MPGFDQSGPMGAGPMTGGARGRCGNPVAGYGRAIPATAAPERGLAYGRGFRGGRGSGRRMTWFYGQGSAAQSGATAGNPAAELNALKAEAELLSNTLKTLTSRITEIEKLL